MAKIGILVNGEDPHERLARLKKEIAEKRARQTEEARQKAIADSINKPITKPNTDTPEQPAQLDIIGTGSIRQLPNGNFLFYDVPYQGKTLECIERPMQYIDSGKQKTQTQHLEWLSDPNNNPGGFTIADMELEYQLARISFELRNDPTIGTIANSYITQIRELYNKWIITADHIQYTNGLEAIITNKGTVPSKSHKKVIIPTLTNNYYTLSNERPENQLNDTNTPDAQLDTFLKKYLGQGHQQAGIILPYCSSRLNNNLRETRIWTPDTNNRKQWPERVGALVVCNSGWIYLDASGIDDVRSALGVAVRPKNFYNTGDQTQ